MSLFSRRGAAALAGATAVALGGLAATSTSAASAATPLAHPTKHVVLISIDGMHESDLNWFVHTHPTSTLAMLKKYGANYTNALTSNPSDSDPGGTAIMTGGNPKSTGVYYDVEYSHSVLDPTATSCIPGQHATGGNVVYDSPDDATASVPDFLGASASNANGPFPAFDENGSIYGVNGVDHNPARIMNLRNSASSFNYGTFPISTATCNRVTPWDYLGDNTIFQVIHAAGKRTAWSDKHAIYMSFNGPGSNGKSIDDFFGPEIDSQAVMPNGAPYLNAAGGSDDWAHIDAATKQYDAYKVNAVLNEINGRDHSGRTVTGVPAVLGMNFQAVSVAQKLPVDSADLLLNGKVVNYGSALPTTGNYTVSAPEQGGYTSANVPGPVVTKALTFVSQQLARVIADVRARGLASSTTFVITAKHGQSPTDPSQIRTLKDGPIVSDINSAWTAGVAANAWAPGAPAVAIPAHPANTSLIVAGTDDDLWQSYLSDHSQAADTFVVDYLMSHSATAYDVNKNAVTIAHDGVQKCYAGAAARAFFGAATPTSPNVVTVNNGRNPDVFCQTQVGVVYAGAGKKLAEHGGMNPQDRHVLMIVWGANAHSSTQTAQVETTQVAPTILWLLGLNPSALRAVRVEGTTVLPGA